MFLKAKFYRAALILFALSVEAGNYPEILQRVRYLGARIHYRFSRRWPSVTSTETDTMQGICYERSL